MQRTGQLRLHVGVADRVQVRGPALAKLGFQPTAKGLVEYMDCREPKDDLSGLSDKKFVEIFDAHNRIVALMSAGDPTKIRDAMSARKGSGGAAVDMAAAFDMADDAVEQEEKAAAEAAAAKATAEAATAADGSAEK